MNVDDRVMIGAVLIHIMNAVCDEEDTELLARLLFWIERGKVRDVVDALGALEARRKQLEKQLGTGKDA